MRIIEIAIEEFGGLKNFNKTFSDGLNMIFEPNGFGKTTVAAFIKAMLYGFPMSQSADPSKNPRLRMTPWSGNDFGGTMLVETDGGQRYTIERIFSAKGYMDTVRVYNAATGNMETELLPSPGEKLLKVGGENFDKCIYTPQNRVKADNDVSLTARLGRALEENGGGRTMQKAAGTLNETLAALAGEEGRLKKITAEIAKVQKQIKAADAKRARQLSDVRRKAELRAKIIKYEAEAELLKASTIPQAGINRTAALYQKVERQKQDKQRQIEAMREHLTGRKLTGLEEEELRGYLEKIKEPEAEPDAPHPQREKEAADNTELIKKESLKVKGRLAVGKGAAFSRRLKFLAWGSLAVTALCAALAATGFALSNPVLGGIFTGAAVLAAGAGVWLWRRAKRLGIITQGVTQGDGGIVSKQWQDDAPHGPPLDTTPPSPCVEGEKALLTEKALLLGARIFRYADSAEKLERFLAAYPIDMAALELAKKDIAAFDDTLAEIKARLPEGSEALLSRRFGEEDFDVKIPQKRLKYLETSTKNMIAEVGRIEGEAAAAAETPIPRAALKQLYNNLVKDRDEMEYIVYCIDSAIYHLHEGREQLLNNYAPPLKANMAEYLKELSTGRDMKASLDNDLNISIIEKGEPRDLGYFSQGLQDLGYFALRMAMLDLIYKTEKPFIVLDEPFVNFDDRHMETARALLAKIAAGKQVIYMTSQESRKV